MMFLFIYFFSVLILLLYIWSTVTMKIIENEIKWMIRKKREWICFIRRCLCTSMLFQLWAGPKNFNPHDFRKFLFASPMFLTRSLFICLLVNIYGTFVNVTTWENKTPHLKYLKWKNEIAFKIFKNILYLIYLLHLCRIIK
jgi:hypothetical protein